MQELAGKTAVVTGGASGLGRAMASRFARSGMKIVLVDVEAGALSEVTAALEASGAEVLALQIDVSDASAMDGLAESALARFGAVHIVCNNAGVGSGGPMWELTSEDWEFCMRPNLWGVIHGVRVFTKHLIAQNEGHVINTASMAGLVTVPGMAPYNVTKHAVVTLSESLYHELAGIGSAVGVSVLCPGHVNTRIWESHRNRPDELAATAQDPESEEQRATHRMFADLLANSMAPEDVADLVHEAVLDGTFYIHTHENVYDAVRARLQGILDAKEPATPEGGQGVFSK